MPKPGRQKKKPPIEISDEDSISTFSPPSPSPILPRVGEKRGHPQSSPKKENQKPAKKTTKPITTTDSVAYTPEKCLTSALDYLTKACIGLEGEEEKEELKKQVKQLVYHTEYIIAGKSPFVYKEEEEEEKEEEKEKKKKKEKEKEEREEANNILKELVKEVRALCKEVAPTKETYIERLKKDLPSSSSSSSPPSLPLPSPTPLASTRSKKKQL